MNTRARTTGLLLLGLFLCTSSSMLAQEEGEADVATEETVEETGCTTCHGDPDLWEQDTRHLFISAGDLASDAHWHKGISCHDCHGGNSETLNLRQAHAIEDGFRLIESTANVATLCGHCHSDPEYMKPYASAAKPDPVASFLKGAHGKYLDRPAETAITCLSCHPKHSTQTFSGLEPAAHAARVSDVCGHCHQDPRNAMLLDVHGRPPETTQNATLPLACTSCHGADVHGMLSVDDPSSPVFVDHQLATCGNCHPESRQSYDASVHGQGLSQSGLLVTATCSSCHGDHGIFPATDERSMLHVTKVAETCSSCHRFIHERLQQSVHGRKNGLGQSTDTPAPGGDVLRTPNCIDCHQGHDQPSPATARFRRELSSRCGDCHADLQQQYYLSIHGELTDLGYGPAANCSDCHGDHDVLPVADPASLVAPGNRLATCQKCHPDAPPNFADFDPHADHRDPEGNPVLYWVYVTLMTLLLTTIGVWLLHSLLWFTRSLFDLRRHPRPKGLVPGETAYVRFTSFHRLAHVGLLVSFLGLTLTGLPLKYSHTQWAHFLANLLGGFSSTGLWHRIFGLANFAYLIGYVLWAMYRMTIRQRRVGSMTDIALGGDSPIPNRRDWTDFAKMMRWFFGRGPKPTFERWAYWEKIDVWGAMADIVIIGLTGMILWFPELVTRILPGETLNIAKVIHSTQALLATGFVFAIHFFNTHVRPDKFPMDLSMFVGLVSEEEMREERGDYYERLRREGRLEELQATVPPRRVLRAVTFGGAIAVAIGTGLLVGIIAAIFGA